MAGDINPRAVKTSPAEPVVYRGRDNVVATKVEVYTGKKYTPMDFTDVDRVVLILCVDETDQYVFDTQTTPGVVDWSQGGGHLEFDITKYAMPSGIYDARVVVYDPEHTSGQVLIDGEFNATLTFTVVEVYTSGQLPPPIVPGGGESVVRIAGETISALKCVYELDAKVYVLGSDDGANIYRLIGVAVSSGNEDDEIIIQRDGTIDDSSFGFDTVEPRVYLGVSGSLTQVPPTTGWSVLIGSAASATRLNMNIQDPIEL